MHEDEGTISRIVLWYSLRYRFACHHLGCRSFASQDCRELTKLPFLCLLESIEESDVGCQRNQEPKQIGQHKLSTFRKLNLERNEPIDSMSMLLL